MGEVRFMISEAAKKVQVESHVLRYWEEELHIPIGRTEMGHRYYTQDDIQLFCCIKKLKNEGVLLRDLKPLIPELKSTRQIMRHTENKEKNALTKTPAPDLTSECKPATTTTPVEVITKTQLEHVRSLIGEVLTEVVSENNKALEKEISTQVTADVIREMDFLFQAKERQEEEHFRKLDSLIRQQQATRRESVKNSPVLRFKKDLHSISAISNCTLHIPVDLLDLYIEKRQALSNKCLSFSFLYLLILLTQLVSKTSVLWHPRKTHCTDRAVSLFCDNNFCNVLIFRVRIIIIITIDKHTDIGILLDCSGFSEV